MFNGHKPHHPNVRFFLYFAERRGRGCCCAWADKSGIGSAVFALGPAQRPLGLLRHSVGPAADTHTNRIPYQAGAVRRSFGARVSQHGTNCHEIASDEAWR